MIVVDLIWNTKMSVQASTGTDLACMSHQRRPGRYKICRAVAPLLEGGACPRGTHNRVACLLQRNPALWSPEFRGSDEPHVDNVVDVARVVRKPLSLAFTALFTRAAAVSSPKSRLGVSNTVVLVVRVQRNTSGK